MTQIVMAPNRTAPTPVKRPGSLLDTADVTDGLQRLEAVTLYTSMNCAQVPGLDPAPACGSFDAPTFNVALENITGTPFVATSGYQCQALGTDWNELNTLFDRTLMLQESLAVEQALMTLRFTGTSGGPIADDITPTAGAVKPEVGLALLEGYNSNVYVGRSTIHAPVTIASLLLTRFGFKEAGNRFYSPYGSSLVAGAGYQDNVGPDGTAPDDGEMWLYVTGTVSVGRGPRLFKEPILNRSTNVMSVLSQRIYVADVDCPYIAAVRVTIS